MHTLGYVVATAFITTNFVLVQRRAPYALIDEIFHVPQAQAYCADKFHVWDSKITTLPGSYLWSYSLLKPFLYSFHQSTCSIHALRLTNLVALLGIFWCVKYVKGNSGIALLVATNPLLVTFSALYYTDVPSTLSVLLVYVLAHTNRSNNAIMQFILAALSVMMRQTNILWVGLIAFYHIYQKCHEFQNIVDGRIHLSRLFDMVTDVITKAFGYILALAAFVAFLVKNDGIVVGDKNAHVATFHGAQIMYCWAFIALLNIPTFLQNAERIVRSLKPISLIMVCAGCWAAVQYSSKVHKYLLADNRHIAFYIWNKLLQYETARLTAIPVYIISILGAYNLWSSQKSAYPYFHILFIITAINCAPQLLFELRYFILPAVFFQLHAKINIKWTVYYNLLISSAMLAIFMLKDVYWADVRGKQMIIW